ncbi:hypothetical protein [Burkholderia cepacia]|nr:hypothetical protein [Burkholderia cepacia]
MDKKNTYRIGLAGNWSLPDLAEFSHALDQCYAFIYCLETKHSGAFERNINNVLSSYPWEGGFSYVNAYALFERQVPSPDKPMLLGIRKNSPGWLDLALNHLTISNIATAVSSFYGVAHATTSAYKKAAKFLTALKQERQKRKLEGMAASTAQLKQMQAFTEQLAKGLGFKNVAALDAHTKSPEISLKLMMSYYRRLMVLTEMQNSGKVDFSAAQLPDDKP